MLRIYELFDLINPCPGKVTSSPPTRLIYCHLFESPLRAYLCLKGLYLFRYLRPPGLWKMVRARLECNTSEIQHFRCDSTARAIWVFPGTYWQFGISENGDHRELHHPLHNNAQYSRSHRAAQGALAGVKSACLLSLDGHEDSQNGPRGEPRCYHLKDFYLVF